MDFPSYKQTNHDITIFTSRTHEELDQCEMFCANVYHFQQEWQMIQVIIIIIIIVIAIIVYCVKQLINFTCIEFITLSSSSIIYCDMYSVHWLCCFVNTARGVHMGLSD